MKILNFKNLKNEYKEIRKKLSMCNIPSFHLHKQKYLCMTNVKKYAHQ